MRLRTDMSAAEVAEFRRTLSTRLEHVGMTTQPEVAAHILKLISDPSAQVRDYARAIGTDPGLSGRLLKLVNSAAFGQNSAVTSLERACTLLGIEKLRSFSLGFYLCRAAIREPGAEFSRRVWGQSVYRACLCAELARRLAPRHVSEAFVVGLIMDSGLPLLPGVVGDEALEIIDSNEAPSKVYLAEYRRLPVTHVDVVTALVRRWGLPRLIARPIELHHVAPTDPRSNDAERTLHRIAYYVGALGLHGNAGLVRQNQMLPELGSRVLELERTHLGESVRRAADEYGAIVTLFADVADFVADHESLAFRVHTQLVALIDSSILGGVNADTRRFVLGGFEVEIRRDSEGSTACIIDAAGNPIVCHRIGPGPAPIETLCRTLGVEPAPGDRTQEIDDFLRRSAA